MNLLDSLFFTPRYRATINSLLILVLLAGPFATIHYFTVIQERGCYSAGSDSIAIPIFSYCVGWLIVAPLFCTLATSLTKHYRGRVSIGVWSKYAPWKSTGYTLAAAVWIISKSVSLVSLIYNNMPWNAVYDASWILLVLWLRAAAVSRLKSPEELQQEADSTCSCDEFGYYLGREAESYMQHLELLNEDNSDLCSIFRCPVCGIFWEKSYRGTRIILAQVTPDYVKGKIEELPVENEADGNKADRYSD